MEAEGLVGRTLIGRFRIDKILGRGGMATVYAAFDQQRGLPVALKVLKRELTRDSMVLRRFEREAKAASQLRHPNVVEVLDWGVDGEEAFISMELAQGIDLLKALARQRPMKQVRAVLLLSQVCAALSAAHSKGIVHRDLKPENVLLVSDPTEPGGDRAKVLDFGIAKILDVSKSGGGGDDPPSYVTKTALTRVGTIVGTPAYMSPEQCRGGEIDGRSDVYACGVLLYQLVTGELPFTGETPLHTAMRHIHAQPRAPSELRSDLAPSLERVISKALSKWPGERQQTAQQLRDELLATLPDLPDRADVVLPEGLGAPTPPPRSPAPAPAPKVAPGVPSAAANGPESVGDTIHPTRQLVSGRLGATPLMAVRLGRATADEPFDGAASTPDPGVDVEEDDEQRTLSQSVDLSEIERNAAMARVDGGTAGSTPAPTTEAPGPPKRSGAQPGVAHPEVAHPGVAHPGVAHPGVAHPEVKTDPMAQAKLLRPPHDAAPSLASAKSLSTPPRSSLRADRVAPRPLKDKPTHTGLTPTMSKVPARPAAPRVEAATDAMDDDEPATHIREPSPASPQAKTLVMDEPSSNPHAARHPHAPGAPAMTGPNRTPLTMTGAGPHASYPDPAHSPSRERGNLRELKATARISEEAVSQANPYNANSERLQAVKATLRMTPQEDAHHHQPASLPLGHASQNQPVAGALQPALAPHLPTSGQDSLLIQTGYRQLQPGSWNEATVVKRRAPAPSARKEGIVGLIQGLSGPIGVLIGIGLGLGIAAGLLIAFLLFLAWR